MRAIPASRCAAAQHTVAVFHLALILHANAQSPCRGSAASNLASLDGTGMDIDELLSSPPGDAAEARAKRIAEREARFKRKKSERAREDKLRAQTKEMFSSGSS